MADNLLPVDEAMLTAYALGELDAGAATQIEQQLATSPAARAAVDEIRELAGLLQAELGQESTPELSASQREAIVAAASPPVTCAAATASATGRWRRSQIITWGATAASLGIAGLVTWMARTPAGPAAQRVAFGPVETALNLPAATHGVRPLDRREGIVDQKESESLRELVEQITPEQRVTLQQGQGRSLGLRQELARTAGGSGAAATDANGIDAYKDSGVNSNSETDRPARLVEDEVQSEKSQPASLVRSRAGAPAAGGAATVQMIDRLSAGQASDKESKEFFRRKQFTGKQLEELRKLSGAGAAGNPALGVMAPSAAPHRFAEGGFGVLESAPRGVALSPDGSRTATATTQSEGLIRGGRALHDSLALYSLETRLAEVYAQIVENPFVSPSAQPLSTFGVDVDTASYANVRRFLTQGQMPPPNAVRIEEMVNYFRYSDPAPANDRPFSINVEVGMSPWQPGHRLARIGLRGREVARDRRPLSNLVFLVDVSGSMADEKKLPLVKSGLTMLAEQMTESDRVAIVTYSDTAAVRLPSTTGDKRQVIRETIDALRAAGSTNGAAGIQLAYRTAIEHFIEGGTNRVILCTDGDFNVGVSSDDELVRLIQDRARSKVFFSVLGFGMGNLKDGKLEKLADHGNGHYAYIDGDREAQKVFVEEMAGNLVTIAKDVKLQVEFNPGKVGAYRLIGYENRALAAQDFADDTKDAGDIGAGHSVTALYEIMPSAVAGPPAAGEGLRYQKTSVPMEGDLAGELMTVKLRYKLPEGDESQLVELPVRDRLPVDEVLDGKVDRKGSPSPSRPSRDFEWAAAVAAFGMVLRDSQFRGQAGLDLVHELAQGAVGEDSTGRRQEFLQLVQQARALRPDLAGAPAADRAPPAAEDPAGVPAAAPPTPEEMEKRAAVEGRYRNLLRILRFEADAASYGAFYDYGRWEGTSYGEHKNLPRGYWVYVAPNWYIWGDRTEDPPK